VTYYVNEEGDHPTLGVRQDQDNRDLTFVVPNTDKDYDESNDVQCIMMKGEYKVIVKPGEEWCVVDTRCYENENRKLTWYWVTINE